MRIKSAVVSGYSYLAGLDFELSKDASRRLKWFDYYDSHGRNARLTCRYFGISPQTFYRWKGRYDPKHFKSLESHSCRPRKLRSPTYSPELAETVRKLREQYPRWGKDKILVKLNEQGYQTAASTVGRIIHCLKERGVLKEPIFHPVSASKRLRVRPYAQRKPKEYMAKEAGDLVQLDTLDIRPLPGVVLKHFTAHDVISKWNVVDAYPRATATTAAHFLDVLEERLPFRLKAIQVDGGAEFEALFEEECQKRGIQLFVLPPRSPKLNGGVERAHRTHTEEFYEVTESTFELSDLKKELLKWEIVYNTIRPHQALGYLTPLQFLQKLKEKGGMCH